MSFLCNSVNSSAFIHIVIDHNAGTYNNIYTLKLLVIHVEILFGLFLIVLMNVL